MKLLLDTHAVIWWVDQDGLLSPAAHAAIADPSNELPLSARAQLAPVSTPPAVACVLRYHRSGCAVGRRATHSRQSRPAGRRRGNPACRIKERICEQDGVQRIVQDE